MQAEEEQLYSLPDVRALRQQPHAQRQKAEDQNQVAGNTMIITGMVEAGGVEPPSEEPNSQETTCLSRSLTAFADGPKERAITNRQLASVPPQRISPKIPRR